MEENKELDTAEVQTKPDNTNAEDGNKDANDESTAKIVEDLSDLPPIVAKDVVMPMSSFGIGPVFGGIAIVLTGLGIFFRNRWIFKSGIPSSDVLRYIYLGLGIVLCLAGLFLWLEAVGRVDRCIKTNKLCTDGVYAWTRNPIYAGILLICTGALFISGNVYMYFIPILLWGLLTILLKKTEEPDLIRRFGDDYLDYMIAVNRVLPKPTGKKK